MNFIFKFLFKILGWKTEGDIPYHIKKGIFVVAPHNTTQDFFIGLAVRAAVGLKIGFLGKAELFKPPFGFIFRWLGGTPVFRTQKLNMVESHIAAINKAEDMLFAIAPEGTRKNVKKLRTGFYYMALGAGIPIIRVGFDLPEKKVIFAEPFIPSGNFKADMQKYFVPFFENIGGMKNDWIENYRNGIFGD